jgi:hypothetical protein
MKQSFSITTSQGQHLHLISYYARQHPGAPELPQPSTDPSLRHIHPLKGMYPESSMHDASPPAMTRTPMQPYNNPAGPQPQDQGTCGYWAAPAWMGPWPPSPNHTPPSWINARLESESNPHTHQPSLPHRPPPPQLPASGPANHSPIYERLPGPVPYQMTDRNSSLSPRSHQLQVQAAQAVMTSVRNPQGPLPAMSASSRGHTPPRTKSLSPPGTSGSDGYHSSSARKASLSTILLHPTPSNSEPNSAHPANNSSASSSPRALAAAAHEMSADVKALRSLDRKFCI